MNDSEVVGAVARGNRRAMHIRQDCKSVRNRRRGARLETRAPGYYCKPVEKRLPLGFYSFHTPFAPLTATLRGFCPTLQGPPMAECHNTGLSNKHHKVKTVCSNTKTGNPFEIVINTFSCNANVILSRIACPEARNIEQHWPNGFQALFVWLPGSILLAAA